MIPSERSRILNINGICYELFESHISYSDVFSASIVFTPDSDRKISS